MYLYIGYRQSECAMEKMKKTKFVCVNFIHIHILFVRIDLLSAVWMGGILNSDSLATFLKHSKRYSITHSGPRPIQ